ncbi:CRISPR-associated Csd1 family protein [Amycolatopsis cihanbeyliensis]|uniref:CRISPR-associated Csd1 family protein n=2 Tax=Amycolatopsis cihanbeyliensis TaxID=1128664 RepID=A0A542DEX9_AMYCI|nr:CRISPR-associated Csd1 family protein [Amycolatopsis cihanbeyliensis]
MLLQRLAAYAGRDATAVPFHRDRQFHWELRLDEQGQPCGDSVESLVFPDTTGTPRGAVHRVPAVVRTVGVAPNLAADDVQYVLGWSDRDSKPARVAQCHAAFAELMERWANSPEGRHDPVAQAVAACYRSGALHQLRQPTEFTAKQGVLITVANEPAYQAPSVVPFWTGEVARRKGAGSGLCLVCGTTGPLLDTVPGKVPARLVPGASNDAALVSVNERVFGYDLTTQLTCSPMCLTCGEAISAGLVNLLDSPQTASYGGQDSRLAWWTTAPVTIDPVTLLFDPDPDQVHDLLGSVHTGTFRPADAATFCALTVGGNISRVMVRDWLEMPLTQLEQNITTWFHELEIAPLYPQERPHASLEQLVRVTGRWLRRDRRYARLGSPGAARPDGIQRDLLRSALRRTALPPSVLAHLLHRVRTDGRLDTARAGLIRLALLRSPLTTETPMPGLDPTNTDPSYVAGRTFAALEALQYDATGGALNSTYGDRYFAGAITNPRAALVTGRKDANAWLRKLRRSKRGAAVNHEKTLDELFELLAAPAGLPGYTTVAQQAQFLLGYHHQRAHRFATLRRTTTEPEELPA